MKKPRVAIVHDYLQEFGGAERVVLSLCKAFPQAPLYVGFYDPAGLGEHAKLFKNVQIISTCLEKIPFHQRLRSPLRILAPRAFARLDLSKFDVVIASTNAYHAKAVQVRPDAALIVYCHTPARSLYGYDTRSQWRANGVTHFVGGIANHFLRLRDWEDAQRASMIVVNSATVARRVEKYWRRESTIVYPPVSFVDSSEKNVNLSINLERTNYVYVNRLNFAKHPEIAVQAAIDLDLPLTVVGDGPLLPGLAEMILRAGKTESIRLLGSVSDAQLAEIYQHARALLYPVADEDFGIVPVEAMAYGTPVIAHASGGPLETIIEGKTGLFFQEMSVNGLKNAIKKSQKVDWDPRAIRARAAEFSETEFIEKMRKIIDQYAKRS